MNEIEKLIQELCPDGVEHRRLGEVTAWDKRFNGVDRSLQKKVISYPYVLAKVFDEIEVTGGDVKLLSTGKTDVNRWTTQEVAGELVS